MATSSPPKRLAVALASIVLIAGCAKPGDYAALLPRAAEQAPSPRSVAPAGSTDQDHPAPEQLKRHVAQLLETLAGGDSAFGATLAAQRRIIERAQGAAPMTEAWIAGQQALSALEAARSPSMITRDELDTLYTKALGDGIGLPLLVDARSRAERLVAAQNHTLTMLSQSLSHTGTGKN